MMQKISVYLFVFFLLLTGCSSNVKTFESTKTLGEQLEDLDKSYQQGILTEQEYNKAKNILINKYK